MSTIEELNDQYIKAKERFGILQKYDRQIVDEAGKKGQSDIVRATKAVASLSSLSKETNISLYPQIQDTLTVGSQYIRCLQAINSYKKTWPLQGAVDPIAVRRALDKIKEEQYKYDDLKEAYSDRYGFSIDSAKALERVVATSVRDALSKVQNNIKKLKFSAIEISSNEISTELRITDPITEGEKLPDDFLVARMAVQKSTKPILYDIGITNMHQSIVTDLRKQGNVMILTDFEHFEDRQIDDFVVAYILRIIDSFPLGAINIHIFDQNTHSMYKRLYNSFQSETSGEITKKVVQIHTDYNDLAVFRDVNCEDIYKKTSVETPDLFAIYNDDRSDPFNLIVLRDGLVDGSGYISASDLDTINYLTKPGETGHSCGLRFLIIDNSASFDKNLSDQNRHTLNSIQQNCDLRMLYDGGCFSLNGKPVEVLHIVADVDAYIQRRTTAVAKAINRKEKSYVTLNEISVEKKTEQTGNIIYIPIGKSGGNTVELPFSCRDEDGTVAGQCIGYIVIGQSGSGKSSFFHSLVLNGCLKYSPKDLQYWLLDFKNGGASSKYSDSGIPHIRIIAENNKIDDALCLFQMVLEEMERRTKAFNRCFTDNIIEYNKKAIAEGLEYFPRIIIAIDEVQEIFREDNASVLQKLISSISTRMRSAGMHFVMVAQNLSEGKSYMLKEAFMPSATGRICFRVSQDIPRDSGFGDDFIQRKQEISELKTGEAYVSYGKGTIKKVKMVYISAHDMSESVFAMVRSKYPAYSSRKPKVIGSKSRLSILTAQQGKKETYYSVLAGLNVKNDMYDAVLGEDVYRMTPFHIRFSQHENSSLLLLGSDKLMASSLCTSIVLSLLRQNMQIHLFNGDRTRIVDGNESTDHPFMYLCRNVVVSPSGVQVHRLDELKNVLKDMYTEYLSRQAIVQKAEDDDTVFPATVLIVNDLFGIGSFVSNDVIESDNNEKAETSSGLDGFNLINFSISTSSSTDQEGRFKEGIQTIMGTLLKDGYRYNLHVVLAIRGDPSIWRAGRVITGINNILLFNDTEYADQIENSYYLKEMLKNISNDDNEETQAVYTGKKTYSKIRPIIYKMNSKDEREALYNLINS